MSSPTEVLQRSPGEDGYRRAKQLLIRIEGRLHLGLRFETGGFGLRRDLNVAFERPEAKIPISVRPLVESDLATLLPIDSSPVERQDRFEVALRRRFASQRIDGGYVAIDDRYGMPCYLQWLFGAVDNKFIEELGGFPQLAPDEALLENAYTPPQYRGMRIMPAAMSIIAEKAKDIGARHVLKFVCQDNIASLKGCQRSGFSPDIVYRQVRYGFGIYTRDRFSKLAHDDPRRVLKF